MQLDKYHKILVYLYILFGFYTTLVWAEESIKHSVVKQWADKFGAELWHVGDYITKRDKVQESFKPAQIVTRSGPKIVEDMAKEIKYMMDAKVSAIKRIMEIAENSALSESDKTVESDFKYYNALDIVEPDDVKPQEILFDENGNRLEPEPPQVMVLTENANFFKQKVNLTHSVVQVPTNVYDRATEVIKAIKWSEALDQTFVKNYRDDPSLSWQFFGSTTGILRQYPGSHWTEDPVDLFDARLRPWYIEAANSPKDVIILMDTSGSMQGQRKDIAVHVVKSILDTLGPNDYVNIYKFNEEIQDIVPCFGDTLVQGNTKNIRELKTELPHIETNSIANFSAVLTKAFEILENFRTDKLGACCNQAIMLVSDGVPYNYEDVFETYNWRNGSLPEVRIFTYLIGKEIADVSKIKWMACANRGFYVHLNTLAEVREQVLTHIPVFARPLVLEGKNHPVIWSNVYADGVDPEMTDYKWEVDECEEQREYFQKERKDKHLFQSYSAQYDRELKKNQKILDRNADASGYNFMITVSIPVYDRRENMTRIANLLGVAGTDLPIAEIKRLMMPFLLGVNGYAFIVTNNGYVLTHPDFRPVFLKILKPAYNNIDVVEVELMDDRSEPREFGKQLLDIRESIIKQTTGSKWMLVKCHLDEMQRVFRMKRQYYWTGIENTPYTLVVTYPDRYGGSRLQTRLEDEIHRVHANGKNVTDFFEGRNWKVHPEWLYCKHSNLSFFSPEDELLFFLDRMRKPGWKWPLNRTPPPPEHTAMYSNTSGRISTTSMKDFYYCDRNLMQALVFDAKVTEWFTRNTSKDEKGNEFKQRFGIKLAFLATHSGLTRWIEFTNHNDEMLTRKFHEDSIRAVDEVWYRRAVEQYFVEEQSFVYSVPFSSTNFNDTLVTASHAIFHTEGSKSAPAAVVGFQFQHSALHTLFKNITSTCADCQRPCSGDDVDCFVLDNNGFVVVGPKIEDTGKFYGEVARTLMHRLIEEKVYKEVKIVDYQAVCFFPRIPTNLASMLIAPLFHVVQLLRRAIFYTLFVFLQGFFNPAHAYTDTYGNGEAYEYYEPSDKNHSSKTKITEIPNNAIINKTSPRVCDKQVTLYELNTDRDFHIFNTPGEGCERPYVVTHIQYTNLILLVVDSLCPLSTAYPVHNTQPQIIDYGNKTISLACHNILRGPPLAREKPKNCLNSHPNETYIQLCGKSSTLLTNYFLIWSSIIAIVLVMKFNST